MRTAAGWRMNGVCRCRMCCGSSRSCRIPGQRGREDGMKISTLSIGDELICGEVTDTNASTIAGALIEKGLRVLRHITVGDSEPDIMAALDDLGRASDAVIVTGGL